MIYKSVQENLGYVFNNLRHLEQALTHSSFVYENGQGAIASNERLEFLGDAVLELIISNLLYRSHATLTEGELSKSRANLVCEASLAFYARKLELGKYLHLGRGEAAGGGAKKDSILSDAFEAVIGAIYLDGGIEAADTFVTRLFEDRPQEVISDPKSTLQEEIQKTSRLPLAYEILKEEGPPHQKEFTAQVSHEGRILGIGIGKSKKDAERMAASKALALIL